MKKVFTLSALMLFITCFQGKAQPTVGLTQYTIPNTDCYILFAPIPSTKTYLIDKCGKQVHQWTSTFKPGLSAALLPDGNLLRTGNGNNSHFSGGGSGGVIEKYDWSGNKIWNYIICDSNQCQHHDIKVLPNGNVLVIVWDKKTNAEAIAAGKDSLNTKAELWSEKIVELQPIGADSAIIVWQWNLWDHLVQELNSNKANYGTVSAHPELININYFSGPPTSFDWIHLNSIDYNPTLDQILLSSHNFDEIWIIDHSTTTAQAATHSGGNGGKGGDILYRWGNAKTYNRGTVNDAKFFGQHHATWIPQGYPNAGKIMVFNNGNGRPGGNYSSVDIITPDIDGNNQYPVSANAFLPSSLFWTYTAPTPTDFYGSNISGAQALLNGSFIITEGPSGTFFEIDSDKNKVWQYINPVGMSGVTAQGSAPMSNTVFRCQYYAVDYSGFSGHTLTATAEIETNPTTPSLCQLTAIDEDETEAFRIYPNPANTTINFQPPAYVTGYWQIQLYDMCGRNVVETTTQTSLDVSELVDGVYILKIQSGKNSGVYKLSVRH